MPIHSIRHRFSSLPKPVPTRNPEPTPNRRSRRRTIFRSGTVPNPKSNEIPKCYRSRSSPNSHWCCKDESFCLHWEPIRVRNCGLVSIFREDAIHYKTFGSLFPFGCNHRHNTDHRHRNNHNLYHNHNFLENTPRLVKTCKMMQSLQQTRELGCFLKLSYS